MHRNCCLKQLTELNLRRNQLTDVKGLEKLTQLNQLCLDVNKLTDVKGMRLSKNQLTNVKGLEKLTQLRFLGLKNNPVLPKAQIAELKKALPNCKISHNAGK